MKKLDSLVNNSKLPDQLKEYFTTSESIKVSPKYKKAHLLSTHDE